MEERNALCIGLKLNAEGQAKGRKVIFGGGRRCLHRYHPYRSNLKFNGEAEHRQAPARMAGRDVIRCVQHRETYLRDGGVDGGPHDPVHRHSMKRLPGLYQLDYWEVSIYESCTGLTRFVSLV
jgi:hypothetical protein